MSIYTFKTKEVLNKKTVGKIQELLDTDNHVYLDRTKISWIEHNKTGGISITIPNDEDFRCTLTTIKDESEEETHDCFALNIQIINDDIEYLGYRFKFNNIHVAMFEKDDRGNYVITVYSVKPKCNCPVKLFKVLWTMFKCRKQIANRIKYTDQSRFEVAKEIINGEF